MTQCLRAVAMTRCNRTRQSLTKLRREPSRRVLTRQPNEENKRSLGTILLIILVLLLVGALPTWPYSSSWGYFPTGGLGLLLLIVIILLVLGKL